MTAFDTTPFVRKSIREVVKTLLEAIALVFLVMLLFLQDIRATLIPTIAVPVVLMGTFGVLAIAGYSINMLTMFAVVLAIGLLVDDAIVVVENVERLMAEEGLSPVEATRKSMDQITGALIGIATVLSAVFIPMAFLAGSDRRHLPASSPITIVSAMVLSVIVAVVADAGTVRDAAQARGTGCASSRQPRLLPLVQPQLRCRQPPLPGHRGRLIARPWRYMLVYVAIASLMGLLFFRLPTAFRARRGPGVPVDASCRRRSARR